MSNAVSNWIIGINVVNHFISSLKINISELWKKIIKFMKLFCFSYNSIQKNRTQYLKLDLPNLSHSWRIRRTREWFNSHSLLIQIHFWPAEISLSKNSWEIVRNGCKNTKHRIQEINYARSRTRTFTVLLRGKLIPNEISPISSYGHQSIRTHP